MIGEVNNLLSNFNRATGLVQVGSPGLPLSYDRDWNNFSTSWSGGTWAAKATVTSGLYPYDAFSQIFLRANSFNTLIRPGFKSG